MQSLKAIVLLKNQSCGDFVFTKEKRAFVSKTLHSILIKHGPLINIQALDSDAACSTLKVNRNTSIEWFLKKSFPTPLCVSYEYCIKCCGTSLDAVFFTTLIKIIGAFCCSWLCAALHGFGGCSITDSVSPLSAMAFIEQDLTALW